LKDERRTCDATYRVRCPLTSLPQGYLPGLPWWAKGVMFGLAYGFYRWMFTKTTYNMIIVGLDGAGKTTLLEQSKTMFTDARVCRQTRSCPLSG
jgi:hypothetical protein